MAKAEKGGLKGRLQAGLPATRKLTTEPTPLRSRL
jgi:hypothetical protein